MIIPDVNLLVYAYNASAPRHADAKTWWESVINGSQPVGIPWVVSTGFVRIVTHPKILTTPMTTDQALDAVESWLGQPHINIVNPGHDHLIHLRAGLTAAGIGGNLVTDAHIAAIAIEYQSTVYSNDTDFSRFPGLKWTNPL